MRDTYSSDDYAFTVEDWSDPNHLDVVAVCRNVDLALGAYDAIVREKPGRRYVARWGRSWTMRRSWVD